MLMTHMQWTVVCDSCCLLRHAKGSPLTPFSFPSFGHQPVMRFQQQTYFYLCHKKNKAIFRSTCMSK